MCAYRHPSQAICNTSSNGFNPQKIIIIDKLSSTTNLELAPSLIVPWWTSTFMFCTLITHVCIFTYNTIAGCVCTPFARAVLQTEAFMVWNVDWSTHEEVCDHVIMLPQSSLPLSSPFLVINNSLNSKNILKKRKCLEAVTQQAIPLTFCL